MQIHRRCGGREENGIQFTAEEGNVADRDQSHAAIQTQSDGKEQHYIRNYLIFRIWSITLTATWSVLTTSGL